MISNKNLIRFIEPHYKKNLIKNWYEIKNVNARKFLTHTRFDLSFKLLYLKMINKNVLFSEKIYKEHIRAFSLGKYNEPKNKDKDSIEKFLISFQNVFQDIKNNGFNRNKTLIPLSKNGSIANGAHRIASAIFLNKKISCVKIDSHDQIYDYKFFYNRNVPINIMDAAAIEFIENANNIYLAFIWPVAKGQNEKIEKIIPNIVYKKKINLTYNGAHNLISQIYYNEDWIGNHENNYKGSNSKVIKCFDNFDNLRIIAFQADSLDKVFLIKEKIRKVYNLGKHSIHITDTKIETEKLARTVFNENSIHFLNFAKPNEFRSTHFQIQKFNKYIKKNLIDKKDVVLDSSIILSVYGLREAKDIDFFSFKNNNLLKKIDAINIHDEALKFHKEDKNELIYNPKNYFYFNELKFISFNQIYKMKKNRGEKKDLEDCKMMKNLIENNFHKIIIGRIKQNYNYKKIKFKKIIINILKILRLYVIIRSLYGFIKKNNN